jgi:hypothetical protein
MEKKRFKKLFPNLTVEIETGKSLTDVNFKTSNNKNQEKWADYQPNFIDFLRRCDTEEEAQAIINYLKERNEITSNQAKDLTKKIREHGLRSFGPKKPQDFYNKCKPGE